LDSLLFRFEDSQFQAFQGTTIHSLYYNMCSIQQINHVPINLYLILVSIYWVYFVLLIRVFSVFNYLDSPLLLKYIVGFCCSNCGFCVFRCCVASVEAFFHLNYFRLLEGFSVQFTLRSLAPALSLVSFELSFAFEFISCMYI
jgi:hypothetical protein